MHLYYPEKAGALNKTQDKQTPVGPASDTSKKIQEPTAQEMVAKQQAEAARQQKIEEVKQLNQAGFTKTAAGFTFPGIDPNEIDRKMKLLNTQLPNPVMTIGNVTSDGEVSLLFDQEMLVPQEIDQATYASVFNIMVRTSKT